MVTDIKNHMQSKGHNTCCKLCCARQSCKKSLTYGYDGSMQMKSRKSPERGVSSSGEWNIPCWQSYMQLSSGLLCWEVSPRVPYRLSNCVREGREGKGEPTRRSMREGEGREGGRREGGDREGGVREGGRREGGGREGGRREGGEEREERGREELEKEGGEREGGERGREEIEEGGERERGREEIEKEGGREGREE